MMFLCQMTVEVLATVFMLENVANDNITFLFGRNGICLLVG